VITPKELNPKGYNVTHDVAGNLALLLFRMNQVRREWGKPMIVTSGLRSPQDQARINPKAPKSKHLIGAACDISDPKGELMAWCRSNERRLEQIGLWMEAGTKGWVHFQIVPPRSGARFFLP
jgi:uncharacterized protein YcbK (DUF882 family)